MTKAITVCLWLYCGAAFFDPSDMAVGAKLPLFALALALFLLVRLKDRKKILSPDLLLRVALISLVIPAFYLGLFLARHPGQSMAGGLSLAKGLLALLLVLPVAALKADLRKPVLFFSGLMILSIIGLQACSVLDPGLFQKASLFLTGHYMALIGFRSFGEFDLAMIFFVTTPLLIIPVPFLAGAAFGSNQGPVRRVLSLVFLLLILLASFFSASRAVFFVLLAEYLACCLISIRRRTWLFMGGLAMAAAFFLLGLLVLQRTALLSAEEQSNTVKIAHYESFLEFIDENPMVLLTGDGLGAAYHTRAPGINQEVYQTELTYLDMTRYFGLAGMLVFMLLLAVPFFKIPFDPLNLAGFLAYLVVAGSNPLLFNSTGMLAVPIFGPGSFTPPEVT
jgi:hypothetical protein